VGSIAKCEAPIFPSVCTSEAPLARAYRQHDLDRRPGHLRRPADRLDGTL